MFRNVIVPMGLAAIIAPAMAAEWMTDLDAAREQAAQQGKAILVNFTGSDWCGYCIRLKRDVLDKPEFESYAADKLILVEIDIPRRTIPAEVRAARQELCNRYGVRGFPTLLVLNADGEVLGGFSGARPNVESTTVILDEAIERGRQLAAARALSGLEKARALFDIYRDFPANYQSTLETIRKEIEETDPEDTLGLRSLVAANAQMQSLMNEVRAHHRNFQIQTEIFNRYLAEAHPLNREQIMERKRAVVIFPCLNAMLYHAQTVEDVLKARDYVLSEAEISYPEDIREQMIQELRKTFEDPEALLQKVQQMRARR